MGSRDKDTKSLQDKLKVFFKKGASAALPARNDLVVSPELERELSADTPQHRRLRALKELGDKVPTIRIQETTIRKLWICTRDLLDDTNMEARHAELTFLRIILEGQADGFSDELTIMRTIFFNYLQKSHATHLPEDSQLRFKLLHALTNTGKNIKCFEEQIGLFLLEWLPQIQNPAQLVEFIQLIINVVKFNATYLDEEIVHGIVKQACRVCAYAAEAGAVQAALSLLEAVVCYSLLPRAALHGFVQALCRTVNLEHYCQASWKLMRIVLGADLGHAALQQLVALLGADAEAEAGAGAGTDADAGLQRGAVFYINMALWGAWRVPSLHHCYLAVLPAFLKALSGNHPVVTYEVVLAVQSLVSRCATELSEPTWDVLLQIIRTIIDQDRSLDPPNELIHSRVHALITSVERLQDEGKYYGCAEALVSLVDYCGHERPEASATRLLSAAAGRGALALCARYVRRDARAAVRLHALARLLAHARRRRALGDEAAERAAVAVLAAAAPHADPALRAAAARAVPDLARAAAPDVCTDLVDLLEKILNRPFEMYVTDVPIPADADTSDLKLAVGGLLELLHDKLVASPGTLPTRCYLVLLDHLDQHYKRPALFVNHPDIRMKIFEMLFGLRANASNNVGFCYDASGAMCSGAAAARLRPLCSPYLSVEPPPPPPPAAPAGACVLPAGRAARALLAALTRETDWGVLERVLRALPALLAVRALALGRRAHDLDLLASTLCSMVADMRVQFPEARRPALSELHGAALPALCALAPHHAHLEPHTQQRIVRCLLRYGMVLRTPQPYINALTIFTLEMRETMVKMLPEVLLDLSKISDTKAIASPMLEFLSTLTRLPKVFASFVEDQYMSVFAIVLPYTNPSRYNHYVVSLAHHVIAAWFLKCRLSYRRNFVRFIIHGLHNYIIMPFEEQLQYRSNYQPPANEDSSNRQRSSSLGSRVSRAPLGGRGARGGAAGGAGGGAAGGAGGGAPASAAFHVELTETCVDLLARYTSSPCSVKPQRSDIAEFLFTGGHSMTWLVGHKLVTITTSGCQQNSIKQGPCDRCASLFRQHADSMSSPLPPLGPPPAPRAPAPPAPAATPGDAPVQVQVNDGSGESGANTTNHLHVQSQAQSNPPEVKRQNSAENNKSTDPLTDMMNYFSQRFERISKEIDTETAAGGLGGGGGAGGRGGACWAGGWAEVHVRAPTGDVAWLMRVHNQMSWDSVLESPLQDVVALLAPCASPRRPPPPPAASATPGADSEPRSRSGSGGTSSASAAPELHKSSSDSVVANERRAFSGLPAQQLRMSTQPINIPGSPQRQSSSSTTDDDDMLLIVPEGKSRHPVRRSNSSPEMSSSWKLGARDPDRGDPDDMILLPSCEPASTSMSMHASKKAAKKSDMRVSCEAIPEEMSGTSPLAPPAHPAHPAPAPHTPHHHPHPHPHPHLMTYNSDPGSGVPEAGGGSQPASAAHHQLQKTASDSTVTSSSKPPAAPRPLPATATATTSARDRDDLPPLSRSKRSHTISVMSPTRRRDGPGPRSAGAGVAGPRAARVPWVQARGSRVRAVAAGPRAAWVAGGGVTPSFVFLQLYHNMSTYPITPPVPGEAPVTLNPLAERPLRVVGVQNERTIKNLDLVPPVETYKVGVLYVGPGQQDNEVLILKNEYGSVRYAEFLTQLGTLVPLAGPADELPHLFLNLERGGKDGHYTYVWHDDIMQVLFHVATAMPTSAKDPTCNEKRKYIGNDYVSIVYNDSGAEFNIHTIKGQFNFCIVVVEPYEHGMNRVFIKTKDDLIRTKFLAHVDTYCVSDQNVALLARQIALHCALAAQISQSLQLGGAPYASNSLERLRLIKRLRRRVQHERLDAAARAPEPYAGTAHQAQRIAIDDFNDYT
ncbi:LOW QUALITY PROTEIN: TSC complex subunit tuberin [Aphomia sociella]